eukprot:UN06729
MNTTHISKPYILVSIKKKYYFCVFKINKNTFDHFKRNYHSKKKRT